LVGDVGAAGIVGPDHQHALRRDVGITLEELLEGFLVELDGSRAGAVVNEDILDVAIGGRRVGDGLEVLAGRVELLDVVGGVAIPQLPSQEGPEWHE